MFTRSCVQSRWWRLFALALTALSAPVLLSADSPTEWTRSILGAAALLGLAGYAFGFRLGPRLFWQAFTLVFVLAVTFRSTRLAAPWVQQYLEAPTDARHHPATLAMALGIFVAVALALVRHSEIVPVTETKRARERPAPLLPSQKQRTAEAWQAYAERRAELERPMSPAMQAAAAAFGPMRQLSLKQHGHAGMIMLAGTVVAQITLASVYGGVSAILVPAIALTIGAAAATFFSAEFILKTKDMVGKSWRGMAVLGAVTASTYLIADGASPKLWFARAASTDVLALLVGNMLSWCYYEKPGR